MAALGGVTTILDFLDPIWHNKELNDVFKRRVEEAEDAIIDYSFHITLANYSDKVDQLIEMSKTLGLTSIKVFTTYSESDRRCPYQVIESLLEYDNLIMVHAEDDETIFQPKDISEYEASRSEYAELKAIQDLLELKDKTDGKLYIVHVSSGNTLDYLSHMTLPKNLYLESCPQYFNLSKDNFLNEDGPLYLLAPPLRSQNSIDLLKKNYSLLSAIGTDHCSFTKAEKLKYQEIAKIPKGIGTLGLTFPLMYKLLGQSLIPLITSNPAKIFGLTQKGAISVGKDADFAVVDHEAFTQTRDILRNMNYTIYPEKLQSQVIYTIVRGRIVMDHGLIHLNKGNLIRRKYESNH